MADAIRSGNLCVPPIVITEILSDPAAASVAEHISNVEKLEISEGFWERAAETRRTLKRRALKCKLADAFIAQSCIDHAVALITRDGDFRHFAKYCGLKLA